MTPKEFIKEWFANIDAKNFDKVKDMIDNGHVFSNPMTPAPVGKEEHLGMVQMITSSFTGGHVIDHIISEGEWVTARGRYVGTHTGDFNGVPPTGKKIEFSWIDMMHISNGKVKEEFFELNPMGIMQQIGAVPA